MRSLANMERVHVPIPDLASGNHDSKVTTNVDRVIEFENLVLRSLPKLRRIAMRQLRNREDAEDAVQDALLSAFKHIADFEGRAQMSSWLMSITLNSIRMQLRGRRYRIVSIDPYPEDREASLAESVADARPNAERRVAGLELHQLVTKLGKVLPRSQWLALRLRHVDGLSTQDAASVLDVPVGTLKAQLSRGRARLTRLVLSATSRNATGLSLTNLESRRKTLLAFSPPLPFKRRAADADQSLA